MRLVLTGQVGRAVLTVVVVVGVPAGVLPQIADHGRAWELVLSLAGGEVALLAGVGRSTWCPPRR